MWRTEIMVASGVALATVVLVVREIAQLSHFERPSCNRRPALVRVLRVSDRHFTAPPGQETIALRMEYISRAETNRPRLRKSVEAALATPEKSSIH
jgi:hypothetical protein